MRHTWSNKAMTFNMEYLRINLYSCKTFVAGPLSAHLIPFSDPSHVIHSLFTYLFTEFFDEIYYSKILAGFLDFLH